jgi:hypothetical protein
MSYAFYFVRSLLHLTFTEPLQPMKMNCFVMLLSRHLDGIPGAEF